jgi:S1-C subfamily serine protease
MRDKLQWLIVIVVSMALGAAVAVGIDAAGSSGGGTSTVIERVSSPSGEAVSASVSDVADLYAQVRPSIVQITGASGRGEGLGSGIVLDKQGNILTNNHVIQGFTQIDVTFYDGTSVAATVVGRDAGNDLAVIKVDVSADKLQPAKLGESSKVRVGEMVIAIGNPFGREASVSEGIVSGLGRTLSGGTGKPLRQLIQSDAAINPGNSGGALFNARGEVIGITTAIENTSGANVFAGIGYAVPVDTAARFLPDMLAGRQVQHPRMGISMTNLTPAQAQGLGLSVERGVLVRSVENNSAAQRAGIRGGNQGGDVIVAIDGKEMRTYDDLANYIDSKQVGDKVQVKLVRGGQELTVEVTLEAWRDNTAA